MESECQSNKRGDSDTKTCILPFQFELDIKGQGRIVSRGYTRVPNLVSQCQKQKKVYSRPGIFAERRMDRQTDGQSDSYIPLKFFHKGYYNYITLKSLSSQTRSCYNIKTDIFKTINDMNSEFWLGDETVIPFCRCLTFNWVVLLVRGTFVPHNTMSGREELNLSTALGNHPKLGQGRQEDQWDLHRYME